MDAFLVRIYRRRRGAPQEIAGTVERVGTSQKTGFGCARELFDWLSGRRKASDSSEPISSALGTPRAASEEEK